MATVESRNFQLEAFAAAASRPGTPSNSDPALHAQQQQLSPTADKENGSAASNSGRQAGARVALLAETSKVQALHPVLAGQSGMRHVLTSFIDSLHAC